MTKRVAADRRTPDTWPPMMRIAFSLAFALSGAITSYSIIAGCADGFDLHRVSVLLGVLFAAAIAGVGTGSLLAFAFGYPWLLQAKSDAAFNKLPRQSFGVVKLAGWLARIVVVVAVLRFATIAHAFEVATNWFSGVAGNAAGAGPMFAFVVISAETLGFVAVYFTARERLIDDGNGPTGSTPGT